jgi:hypothetical protein
MRWIVAAMLAGLALTAADAWAQRCAPEFIWIDGKLITIIRCDGVGGGRG